MNWEVDTLPQVIEAGALTPELEQTTAEITEALRRFDRELSDEIHEVGNFGPWARRYSDEALREDPIWEHVRTLAQTALADLHELGVITRDLTHPDYNTAVIEVPN